MQNGRTYLKHYLHGLLMGGSDVIPGVSGGTMALILGIYRRLIDSLSSGFSAVLAILRLRIDEGKHHLAEVNWALVVPLALGIVSAIVLAASLILGLIERYPEHTQGLFFGLVAASIAVPWQRIARPGGREIVIALVAAVAAFLLVGMPQASSSEPTLFRVFGSAAVAICAMILPGVSGAFLLKAMGMYEVTLHALRNIDVLYVAVFVIGAVTGLGLFSKLLDYLLDRHHDATMAALVGLMGGGLRALWPYMSEDGTLHLPSTGDPVVGVILLGLAGFVLILCLIWYSDRLEPAAADHS